MNGHLIWGKECQRPRKKNAFYENMFSLMVSLGQLLESVRIQASPPTLSSGLPFADTPAFTDEFLVLRCPMTIAVVGMV